MNLNFKNPIIFYFIISALLCPLVGQNSLEAQEKYSTIVGRVIDPQSHYPVIGATIVALSTTKGAATNGYGKFVISKIPYGIYKLRATAVGFVADEICIDVDRDTTNVNFELPPDYFPACDLGVIYEGYSIITGRVVDEHTHSPFTRATIFLDSSVVGNSRDDGTFIYNHATPGKHKLQARSLGYESKEIDIFIEIDTTCINIELSQKNTICDNSSSVSTKLSTISGTVLDTNSNPVAGATILVVSTFKGAMTDSNGNFIIPKISHGIYKLRISAVGYVLTDTTIDIDKDSITLNFQLKASPIWTSYDLHRDIIADAENSFNEDSIAGHIMLISPFAIEKEESLFAKKYGFVFKSNQTYPIIFMNTYNGRANKYLEGIHGKDFQVKLKDLFERLHGNQ